MVWWELGCPRGVCASNHFSLDQRPLDKITARSGVWMKVGTVPIQNVVGCWGEPWLRVGVHCLLPKVNLQPHPKVQWQPAGSFRDGESKTARALPRSQQDDIVVC